MKLYFKYFTYERAQTFKRLYKSGIYYLDFKLNLNILPEVKQTLLT